MTVYQSLSRMMRMSKEIKQKKKSDKVQKQKKKSKVQSKRKRVKVKTKKEKTIKKAKQKAFFIVFNCEGCGDSQSRPSGTASLRHVSTLMEN